MVRRLFWLALGAAAGIYGMRRVSRAAQAVSPTGLASSLAEVADALRELGAEVRAGMAEREVELRQALGIDAAPTSETKA